MERVGRIETNPLQKVERVVQKGRKSYVRRAFTVDELRRLVRVSGERSTTYLTAAYTGLRRDELQKLEWSDVLLHTPNPVFRLRGETTKNGLSETIPLNADVVQAIKVLEQQKTSKFVFAGLVPRMPRFYADLKAAGIPQADERGRLAHFHSLRHTFATLLRISGSIQDDTRRLMRHSDARLSAEVYTDEIQLPLAAAVNRLPSILGDSQIDSHATVPQGPNLSTPVQSGPYLKAVEPFGSQVFLSMPVLFGPSQTLSGEWCAVQGSNLSLPQGRIKRAAPVADPVAARSTLASKNSLMRDQQTRPPRLTP